jgi:TPR repeat protein
VLDATKKGTTTAFEYLRKAAELGHAEANYLLGHSHYIGSGYEKDEEKGIYHLQKAAIGGNPTARHNLAVIEGKSGNVERAMKHYIIAANLGSDKSMKELWKHYSAGNISTTDLEATLRTHKAAVDATKSSQRDAGDAFYQRNTAPR